MKRIVLDTNFWLSIFIAHRMKDFTATIQKHNLDVFSSNELFREIINCFYHKHIYKKKLFPPFDEYLDFHNEACTRFDVARRSGFIHDYKDNFIYDLCIQARARYFVTNDTDFDILKTYRRPEIIVLTISEFWKVFS